MGILIPNSPIGTVDNNFRTLIARNITRNSDCIFLCCGSCSSTRIAFTFNLPSAVRMGSDMLILSHQSHLTSGG